MTFTLIITNRQLPARTRQKSSHTVIIGTVEDIDDELLGELGGGRICRRQIASSFHKRRGGTIVEKKKCEYDGVIGEISDKGAAYVIFPWNIREEFGEGRINPDQSNQHRASYR